MTLKTLSNTTSPVRGTRARALWFGVAAAALAIGMASPGAAAQPQPQDQQPVTAGSDLVTLAGSYLSARYAGDTNDLADATRYYEVALKDDPDNPFLLDRTVLLEAAVGDLDKAVEHAHHLVALDPANQVALMTLVVDDISKAQYGPALDKLDNLSKGGPLQQLTAGLLKAWALAGNGQPQQAIAFLDHLDGQPWYGTFTQLHKGLIADYAGLDELAAAPLKTAYQSEETALRVVDAYARMLARTGKRDEAVNVLKAFEDVAGDTTFTAGLKAEILAGAPIQPQIRSAKAGAAEALYGLGTAIAREGGDTLGADYLQFARALHEEPGFPTLSLGGLLENMKQYRAAIATYKTIPAASPLHTKAQIQIGLDLNALDEPQQAEAVLRPIADANPNSYEAIVALGNVLRSQKKFADAADVYTMGIKAHDKLPNADWTLYYYRGISEEQTDKWPAAQADFEHALQMSPDEPLVLNYLGYSWIDRGENLDKALKMIEKAVDQRPDDGYVIDSLGWAYYKLGKYDEAVKQLEKAVQLKPADPTINDHLGDAYWRTGRHLEAQFQWAHARDSNPEPKELETIKAKLEHGLGPVANASTALQDASASSTAPKDAGSTPAK